MSTSQFGLFVDQVYKDKILAIRKVLKDEPDQNVAIDKACLLIKQIDRWRKKAKFDFTFDEILQLYAIWRFYHA